MDRMTVQIFQFNNMVATQEFIRQNVEKIKEQIVIDVNELKQEMHKTKAKLNDLLERNKDLDPSHVKKRLEEYEDLVYSMYCIPNNRWMMPMLSLMSDGSWQKLSSRRKCKKNYLHVERMRPPIKDIYLLSRKPFQISLIAIQQYRTVTQFSKS